MEHQASQRNFQETQAQVNVTMWALPEGAIARLERGSCLRCAFSPDEKRFAVGSMIGLWLYDVATRIPIGLWETERGLVSTVVFSSNGALLATGNWDGDINIWDVHRQQCLFSQKSVRQPYQISQLVFSPDGKLLASAKAFKYAIDIWNLETQEHITSFNIEEPTQTCSRTWRLPISFSPDGNWIAGTTPEGNISIWDIEAGESIACLTAPEAPVAALIFSPDGRHLISGDSQGGLLQWDVDKCIVRGTQACFVKLPTYATAPMKLAYASNGTLRAAGKNGPTLIVWDATRGEKLGMLENQRLPYQFGFSPTGSRAFFIWENEIHLWNIGNTAASKVLIPGHRSTCGSVKFSPDGQTLAAGYWSGDICLWDVNGVELQTTFGCEGLDMIRSVDFSPCGNKLAASSYDKTVRVWDIRKLHAPPIELVGHQAVLYAVAFSPKGNRLVSADSKGVLRVWDVQRGYELQMFTEETNWIWSIAFSPDGKYLASAHHEKNARLWSIESGEQIIELSLELPQDTSKYKGDDRQVQAMLGWLEKGSGYNPAPATITFSPDGTVLAGGAFREIGVWDARTYELRMLICQPQGYQRVEALKFSPCGRYLVSGTSWQGTDKVSIRLWEVSTGRNIHTFWGHPTDIQDLAFSPDGSLLVSASYDGTILLWDMKPYL